LIISKKKKLKKMNIEAKENSVIAPQPLTKNPKIIDRPNSQKLRMKENQACTIT